MFLLGCYVGFGRGGSPLGCWLQSTKGEDTGENVRAFIFFFAHAGVMVTLLVVQALNVRRAYTLFVGRQLGNHISTVSLQKRRSMVLKMALFPLLCALLHFDLFLNYYIWKRFGINTRTMFLMKFRHHVAHLRPFLSVVLFSFMNKILRLEFVSAFHIASCNTRPDDKTRLLAVTHPKNSARYTALSDDFQLKQISVERDRSKFIL
jgi:hypothetical protein